MPLENLRVRSQERIDGRLGELKQLKEIEGLKVLRLREDERLKGFKGLYIVCSPGISMFEGSIEDMPANHKLLAGMVETGEGGHVLIPSAESDLQSKDWIHLMSEVEDPRTKKIVRRFAISLWVGRHNGGVNVRAVRLFSREKGRVNREFKVNRGEGVFVIANEVSLTAKKGKKSLMRKAISSLRGKGFVESVGMVQ